MIEKIIEYSVRNRFLIIIVWVAIAAWGVYSVINTPVDAIPDLSENQVIVFADWPGRSPREVEDQVTYPLSVNLQGLAGIKAIRATSEFGFSMINIIFEDKIPFYFARQRVLERLSIAGTFLPQGVAAYLAPDATALGQIFWYTVEGEGYDLGRLRAIQDWFVRYQLYSVPGVAEVASVGGFPIEYQVDVDPSKLRAYGVTLGELFMAVSRANSSVGGRVIQKANAEYLVRSVGWIKSLADVEKVVIKSVGGTPVYVSHVATVQFGSAQRRSSLEKNGNEVVGGVVLMRYGENPLEVTRRIKEKIQQLQAGLPAGVRIVPFYERTRLIHGAIHTLTEILTHEMIIASAAVLLILMHVRSAFVICLTLPLSVLVAFILMRYVGIASNIMSLAGIAISIGVLVDQAIVMVENATHHLTAKFGKEKVRGDLRELVIPACRTVGRPIFFSVMIILLSFLPVFALTGMEGKTFHPLAFTKSFAMVGVAAISVTLVPALIPLLIKGRIRTEQESWLVRTMIDIYKPVLTWALPRWNFVLWSFAVLLIVGAGLFPLQAVFGVEWKTGFLVTWLVVTALTVIFMQGWGAQTAGLASLVVIGLWAYGFHKIGVEFMPPLDEGSILDMPTTVPRASITQAADDLKARDRLLRLFPEVELVVGKVGRAETPTDPAPPDMVETVVNLRPKEHWPKRHLRYDDALEQTRLVLAAMERRGWVKPGENKEDREELANKATMDAVTRLDEDLRGFALERYAEFEHRLAPELTQFAVDETVRLLESSKRLIKPVGADELSGLAAELASREGALLVEQPDLVTLERLARAVADRLVQLDAAERRADLLTLKPSPVGQLVGSVAEVMGLEKSTFSSRLLDGVEKYRSERFAEQVRRLNWELFDRGLAAYCQYAVEALASQAHQAGVLQAEQRPDDLQALLSELEAPFARWAFLWRKSKADLLTEMDTAIQVPGWGNIWTQPIINRVHMLATGVRTMVGVKVYGSDLNEIQRVSGDVAAVLKQVRGAVDVFPDQIVGEGYLQIDIDREKAARYGVSVGDIQDVVETALGGKVITMTVEGRERFPVRVRYARAFREDEEQVKDLLVAAGAGMAPAAAAGDAAGSSGDRAMISGPSGPTQVPLAQVADVRIVEGPSMIKSENGLLRAYVQLNVRGRDIVGFVEEAQQAVADKVRLPAGMYLEWSGEFEHQIRARNTLRVVLPAVMALIFLILYLTYHDFADAVLMMMAVPEALVGGIFFLWLMDKNFSVAVWVGFIACFGMATETGVIMLVYLREALERRGGLENIQSLDELRQAVIEGAVHRLRPKLLTEGVAIVALAPMLWYAGVGHEVISAMAAPVLGGLLIADEVVDVFIPVRFYWVRRRRWLKLHGGAELRGAGRPRTIVREMGAVTAGA